VHLPYLFLHLLVLILHLLILHDDHSCRALQVSDLDRLLCILTRLCTHYVI
jgi:hypothetical protein